MSQGTVPHVCSVCDNQTTKVCSNCQGMYFWSQRCQKLIWPTHKFFCGKDRSTFSFPPLSKAERADVAQLAGRRFDHICERCVSAPQTKVEGASLFEHVFNRDWSSFLDSIAVGDNLIEEPHLSTLLTLVRAHLDESTSVLDQARPNRSNRLDELVSNSTARGFSPLISCRDAQDHFATFDSNPFKRFNQLLQQLTILCTTFVTMRERILNLIPEMRIAGLRLLEMKEPLLETFRLARADPVILDQLVQFFKRWEWFSTMPDLSLKQFQQSMETVRPRES